MVVGSDDSERARSADVDEPPAEALRERVQRRFFDDESPHLDRCGILLLLTIASVAALSLVDLNSIDNDVARGIVSFLLSLTTGLTLVLALRASGVAKRVRRVAEVLVVVAAILTIILLVAEIAADTSAAAFESDRPSTLWVSIAVLSPIAVVRRLLQHRHVTLQTLAGAVAAYLLIALASCYVFFAIDSYLDDGFFGSGNVPSHEFMYFSLVTITTLGYGDLSPADPVGRLAATSEAVIGQVYLVTFVAMVVGLLIQQRDRT